MGHKMDILMKEFDDLLQPLGVPKPEALYHYTTPEGLLGILTENKLWATDIFYLNDSSEFIYGKELILRYLRNPYRKLPRVAQLFKDVESMLEDVESFLRFYVLSFCKNGNLLSQWRSYGDSRAGYSIGIKTDQINYKMLDKVMLRKVVYKPEEQDSYIKLIFDKAVEIFDRGEKDSLDVCVANAYLELICSLKHPAFESEAEWRIVYLTDIPDKDIKLRATRIGIVPYIELSPEKHFSNSSGKLPITKIICGPSLHPKLTMDSLGQLILKYKYDEVKIEDSKVPLRSSK